MFFVVEVDAGRTRVCYMVAIHAVGLRVRRSSLQDSDLVLLPVWQRIPSVFGPAFYRDADPIGGVDRKSPFSVCC